MLVVKVAVVVRVSNAQSLCRIFVSPCLSHRSAQSDSPPPPSHTPHRPLRHTEMNVLNSIATRFGRESQEGSPSTASTKVRL